MKQLICFLMICVCCCGCQSMGSFEKDNLNLALFSETIDEKIEQGEWAMDILQDQLDETEMEAIYGIQSSWIEEYLVRRPLVSITCDEIAIFHIAQDHHTDVIQALQRYLEEWKKACAPFADQLQLIEQAQIMEIENYVIFVCGEASTDVLQYISSLS